MSKILKASLAFGACAIVLTAGPFSKKKPRPPEPSPLDVYMHDAARRGADAEAHSTSPGSLWSPAAYMADLARDVRASQVDDMVTILISENASAVSTGSTKTARTSATKNSITALAGPTKVGGLLQNPLTLTGATTLNGQGTTSRQTTLTASLTARVIATLPNGYLVVEGSKQIEVNSEHQSITVRGVVRPADLTSGNTIQSSRLGQLEVNINGKGVVQDAIHRPMFLYRLILGLLPF